ncbi:major facilitator superfamily domain-containing protein 6-like [Dendronephthya gigantea]|uniref:major facilitator superfamily domain-containing protein 6-like n=1 Tax=Dendronephthya gigantea TaxID=151771 RepID=UPI00106BAAC1|nr:major facilitator superfamily domain-containing protein 6-like [Dendronephthya gigantea]XP_028390704.1 major facilitator superfamily domain-containing protein 6-like [Dendronephthya gigantea]
MNASSAEKNFENPLGNSETKNDGDMVKFFLIILFLRGFFELVKRLSITLITVSAVTHIKHDKSKFGLYAFWGEFGAGISLFIVGALADHITHLVCGQEVPGYYVAFFYAAAAQCMTLISLPWLEYEYLKKRVVDYDEIKSVLLNPHYILVLFICAHAGICTAFQLHWEFWYMRHLGGTPVVMVVGGLLRRVLVGVWYIISRVIIGKLGELYVTAISLFLFAASFAGLAFTENAWLVILLDNFQSLSFVLTHASLVIHFSKAGSKASSAFFQGVVNLTFYGIGKELGSAVIGFCFDEFGTRITFCGFSVVTVAWMAVFTIYIFCAKDVDSYQEVPREEEFSDDDREIK